MVYMFVEDMQTHDSVADRIAHARGLVGLSPFRLSKLAGLSRSAIWLIEDGQREPRETTLERIAPVLGVTVEWLAEGKGKAPRAATVRLAVAKAEVALAEGLAA